MYPLIRLPHFPPPLFPGYYVLFPRVLVPRSQDSEIADTTELGSLRCPMLTPRSPLVKSRDTEDPNLDIGEAPLLTWRRNRKTLLPSGNCFGSPEEAKEAGDSEFDSVVLSIAEGWSNFNPQGLLPQQPNRLLSLPDDLVGLHALAPSFHAWSHEFCPESEFEPSRGMMPTFAFSAQKDLKRLPLS